MITSNTIIGSSGGDGILLHSSLDTIITGNTISNNYAGISLFEYSSYNTIIGNTISNNYDGIELIYSSDNIITGNTIENNNNYGIYVYDADYNNITSNNFIRNVMHASFYESRFNVWFGNYWDDWISIFPRLIWGEKQIPFRPYFIPWINLDWHPSSVPYDIPVTGVKIE